MKLISPKIILVASTYFWASIAAPQNNKIPSLQNKSAVEKIKPGSSFLCIGEKSIGFDWVNGKWENKNYKADRWIIRKEANDATACNLTDEVDESFETKNGRVWNLRRCYSFKRFGSNAELGGWLNTGICYESYSNERPEGFVQCAGHLTQKMAFEPNGAFLTQSPHPFIPPKSMKNIDSHFMETGSCSSM